MTRTPETVTQLVQAGTTIHDVRDTLALIRDIETPQDLAAAADVLASVASNTGHIYSSLANATAALDLRRRDLPDAARAQVFAAHRELELARHHAHGTAAALTEYTRDLNAYARSAACDPAS